MILTEMPTEKNDHPLAGHAPEQRDDLRAQAFGRVLAAIAIRKMEPPRNRDALQVDRRGQANPKSHTEGE